MNDSRSIDRRKFLSLAGAGLAAGLSGCGGLSVGGYQLIPGPQPPQTFDISLAEWSLHRTLRKGEMTNLDFPRVTREKFGLDAVEYVNSFFKDKARDEVYLKDLRQRCEDHGVKSLLIMCDGEGNLGDPDDAARSRAIEIIIAGSMPRSFSVVTPSASMPRAPAVTRSRCDLQRTVCPG